MLTVPITTWILVAWALTAVALLLALSGYRRRLLELLALVVLILLQAALLAAWTVGATAEAAWQGKVVLNLSPGIVDPAFACCYRDVLFWVAIGVLLFVLLAAVVRGRTTRQDRQQFRAGQVARALAFIAELAALVIMAGPANLSNGQVLPGLKDAASPNAAEQMQVVVVRPDRKYTFLPARKTLVFLHRSRGQRFWEAVGQLGTPGDDVSLEHDRIRQARCVWLDKGKRVQMFFDIRGKVFSGWVCLLDYDLVARKQLPAWPKVEKRLPGVEPETRPVTKPVAPPATKPAPPPATKPAPPPATKPAPPPATKPAPSPATKPAPPPATKPAPPPATEPAPPPATKPAPPPATKAAPPPATEPKPPPAIEPKPPPATEPASEPATQA